MSKLTEHMDVVVTRGTVLRQSVEALDEAHYNNELVQLEELIDSAIEYIEALNNQSWDVTKYEMGALTSLSEYTTLNEEIADTIKYHEYNQEERAQAQELCTDKLEDVLADARVAEGKLEIITGIDTTSIDATSTGTGVLAIRN